MNKVVAVLAMAAMLGLAGCSSMGYGGSSAAAPANVVDGVLTNSAGMTLYTFDKDAAGSGKSECNGRVRDQLAATAGGERRQGGRRLHGHHSRRWREAVGLQGQAAVSVDQGHEAGRQDR